MKFQSESKSYRLVQAIYRKYIFPLERRFWKKSNIAGFESEAALYMCSLLPKKTLDVVIRKYNPKTWLDVGCGTGSSLIYIKKQGIEILGLENSELAIKLSGLGMAIKKHDLTIPVSLEKVFDIVWCYEVAEHLPIEAVDEFINTLVRHGNLVILSAAVPGQGGEGHINEQYPEYWIEKMAAHNFTVDRSVTEEIHSLNELYSSNVYCFKRI